MLKSRIWLLILLFICAFSRAQSVFPGQLSGQVVHGEKAISDVHVMNTTSNRATISNEQGNFAISAKPYDTILFSAVQFQRKVLVVSPSMLQSKKIVVPLDEFVNELDEVILMPFDLSGDLSRDMGRIKTGQIVTASTQGLPNSYVIPITQAERKLYEATTGGSGIPLNPIINAISGRTKYLKKVLATERKYARTGRVRDFYADSLFVKELRIPAAKIDDFMYYCEVDVSFDEIVDSHDRLQIWEYLKRKSFVYRRNNDLD